MRGTTSVVGLLTFAFFFARIQCALHLVSSPLQEPATPFDTATREHKKLFKREIGEEETVTEAESEKPRNAALANVLQNLSDDVGYECVLVLICQALNKPEEYGLLGNMLVDYFKYDDYSIQFLCGVVSHYSLRKRPTNSSQCRDRMKTECIYKDPYLRQITIDLQ